MSRNDPLTPKQRRGVAAMLASPTITAAALQVGVTEKTLDRWLTKPAFIAELKAAQAGVIDRAGSRLIKGLDLALDVLVDVMARGNANERRQAAVSWLNNCFTIREQTDLERRLSALEKQVTR